MAWPGRSNLLHSGSPERSRRFQRLGRSANGEFANTSPRRAVSRLSRHLPAPIRPMRRPGCNPRDCEHTGHSWTSPIRMPRTISEAAEARRLWRLATARPRAARRSRSPQSARQQLRRGEVLGKASRPTYASLNDDYGKARAQSLRGLVSHCDAMVTVRSIANSAREAKEAPCLRRRFRVGIRYHIP